MSEETQCVLSVLEPPLWICDVPHRPRLLDVLIGHSHLQRATARAPKGESSSQGSLLHARRNVRILGIWSRPSMG